MLIPTVLSGLFIAAILGKYWFRATWQGGVASPTGGPVVAFVVNASEALTSFWGNPILPSLAGALLAGVVGGKLSDKGDVSEEEALRILDEERTGLDVGTEKVDATQER